MTYRVSLIFLIFFLSGIIYSCFDQCQDNKYYDYKGITIVVENNVVALTDSLFFQINFLESSFIATNKHFNFFNTAIATIDCDHGWGGDKYPLTRISIKSDSEFNSDFPSNTELSSIVKVHGTNSRDQYVLDYIDRFKIENINSGYLYIIMRPESDKVHKLTVEFEKSNGVIVSAVSNQIHWK